MEQKIHRNEEKRTSSKWPKTLSHVANKESEWDRQRGHRDGFVWFIAGFLFVSLCSCVSLCECLSVSAVVSFVPFLSGSFWEEMMRWFLYFANKHSIHLLQWKRNTYAHTVFLLCCVPSSWLSILQMNTHTSCAKSCPIMLHAPLFLFHGLLLLSYGCWASCKNNKSKWKRREKHLKRNAFKMRTHFKNHTAIIFFMRKINRVFHILKSFTGLTEAPITIFIFVHAFIYLPSLLMSVCTVCTIWGWVSECV